MRAALWAFSSALAACSSAAASPAPDWLEGHWLSCGGGRQVSETWVKGRSGVLIGTNVSDDGFEFLRIADAEGVLSYIASPGGGPATAFALVAGDGERAVFENRAHDFPQRIAYARDGDSLVAAIEGDMEGKTRRMEWRFRAAEIGASCKAGD